MGEFNEMPTWDILGRDQGTGLGSYPKIAPMTWPGFEISSHAAEPSGVLCRDFYPDQALIDSCHGGKVGVHEGLGAHMFLSQIL